MPRYEFRIFRQNLGEIEIRLQSYLPAGEALESSEVYIVSAHTDETNVKIRDGVLDIKTLIERRSGLEQWQPTFKSDFPLPADELAQELFPRLAVPTPEFERSRYPFDDFLPVLILPHPNLYVAQVAKLRKKFTVEGCQAELSDVTIEGEMWRTVALESEEPQEVLHAISVLGLEEDENINYVKAIKQVLALSPVSA